MTSEEFFKKENPVRWLFEQFPELNAGQVAKAMGINETLFRNYINGSKRPSAERIVNIENFIQNCHILCAGCVITNGIHHSSFLAKHPLSNKTTGK